ncbi:hypothetical protein Tco_0144786 [Tanacetum coccineum]
MTSILQWDIDVKDININHFIVSGAICMTSLSLIFSCEDQSSEALLNFLMLELRREGLIQSLDTFPSLLLDSFLSYPLLTGLSVRFFKNLRLVGVAVDLGFPAVNLLPSGACDPLNPSKLHVLRFVQPLR